FPPARRRSPRRRTPSRLGPASECRVSLLRRTDQGQGHGHLPGAGLRNRGETCMTADELAVAVGAAAAHELDSALNRIKHWLGQLNDGQVWQRSQPSLNSIGNLILHLCGNLRQWVVAGLGGALYVRNRLAEFAERVPVTKVELVRSLEAV